MGARLETPIQRTYLALGIVFAVLTVLVTCVRFYSRKLSRATFGIDDWLALAAVLFYLTEIAVHLWSMLAGGVGMHQNKSTPAQLELAFKSLTIVEYPYTAALSCIRISIALLLKRIFIQKWFKYCVYGLIFLNISWLLFIYFDAALICRPFAMNWNQSIPGGHCGNKPQSYVVMAVWGIFIDAFTWSLPMFVIWSLKSQTSKKIELSALFALGLFDVAVSIVRIVQLENLDITGDFLLTLAPVEIWSFVEAGVAIIIGNAPACRQAITHIFRSDRSRRPSKEGAYVFSANRSSKKPTITSATQIDDDDMHLWPSGMTSSAYATNDSKIGLEDMTNSNSSLAFDEEDPAKKDPRSITISREVWVTQSSAS